MDVIGHRIAQLLLFGFSAFMVCGGGVFWLDTLPDGFTRTTTYTLYSRLPPAPRGPAYCQILSLGQYGAVLPCNFQPPFVWWLQHR